MSDMPARIASVRARIDAACARSGRTPGVVTLIGVSKTQEAQAIEEAWRSGLQDIGENRVQEASAKIDELSRRDVAPVWHLLGHLQTNKVRAALRCFDILHSVDSLRLAEAISDTAERPVRVLLEVNVGGEASKFGIAGDEAEKLASAISRLRNIDLVGLMTVAPAVDDPEEVRPVFAELRGLREVLGLQHLSMGMTDDFEVAVEEGATMVRVGRAIFGERNA